MQKFVWRAWFDVTDNATNSRVYYVFLDLVCREIGIRPKDERGRSSDVRSCAELKKIKERKRGYFRLENMNITAVLQHHRIDVQSVRYCYTTVKNSLAMEVPEMVFISVSLSYQAESILDPGAKMFTQVP